MTKPKTLVQLVDVLTFVEMIVEPQHITVKAGKEHFAVQMCIRDSPIGEYRSAPFSS